MAEISELTTAVRVAWAKALEDPSCSCPVIFEPKTLCEEIGAKISFEGIERVVLSFNRFDEVGLVPSKMTWNPEDIPGYLAGILHNKCVAVVENPPRWWDLPAGRHSKGGNFSFADGHVEHWRWVTPKIFTELGQPVREDGEIEDFRRVQRAVKPDTRF